MQRTVMTLAAMTAALAGGACAVAQQRPPMRVHTATQAQPLTLVAATRDAGDNQVQLSVSGSVRTVVSNAIPNHAVGSFPNPGNPNRISAQSLSLSVPASPQAASAPTYGEGWVFGVSTNGVPFDPFAAEYWQGDRTSGWNYAALGGAVALGLDENHAHVQPTGTYHYHGIPTLLPELATYHSGAHSPLVGYAADGFPIYAFTGVVEGRVTQMTSGWRLRSGVRPGGSEPGGAYDGAFVQDYEYVAGAGTLDQCNGAITVSAEYPNGTYAYFLTREWPVVPVCFTGTPSTDFRIGPPR